MSIQTEIDRIIGLVDDSYEAVAAKGGTSSTPHLLANLPEAIESIPGGGGSSGGAVETCSVGFDYTVIKSTLGYLNIICCDENGEIYLTYLANASSEYIDNTLIEGVVCGSTITVYCEGMMLPTNATPSNGGEFIGIAGKPTMSSVQVVLKAPTTAGSATIFTIS